MPHRLGKPSLPPQPTPTRLDLQPSRWIDGTPDTVDGQRSRLEEAGGDPDVISEWVRAHGGAKR